MLALDFERGGRRQGVGTALLDGNAVSDECERVADGKAVHIQDLLAVVGDQRRSVLQPQLRTAAHRRLKSGSLAPFNARGMGNEIVLGARLAEQTGVVLHSPVTVISYQGQLTPFGILPSLFHFRVAGIFESGLYDLDSTWAFTSLR